MLAYILQFFKINCFGKLRIKKYWENAIVLHVCKSLNRWDLCCHVSVYRQITFLVTSRKLHSVLYICERMKVERKNPVLELLWKWCWPCRSPDWTSLAYCWSGVWIRCKLETSQVVQWLRLCAPNAGGTSLIPLQGTRSHMK